MRLPLFLCAAVLGLNGLCQSALAIDTTIGTPVRFEPIALSAQFYSEGADFGDIDGDGHNDVVSGPFWYAGPDFQKRYRYTSGQRVSIKAYSQHFFSFVHDFNRDQRPDILVVGMPGQPARWFENPGAKRTDENNATWEAHHVLNDAGNESPVLVDLVGDAQPELVCVHAGAFGYAAFDKDDPTKSWQFTPLNNKKGFGHFTHGLGVGDIDGDGRADVLETNGWHQQLAKPASNAESRVAPESIQPFNEHSQRFAQSGGAQMFAYDFDGDGDNDVLSVQNAHGYGLTWFERRGEGDDFLWVPHEILTDKPNEANQLPAISQMHGVALADMDGDGVKDIVTGKRFYAHGGGDPGAFQLPVLYWFQTVRTPSGVRFVAHLISNRIGIGTQLTVGDINGDGTNDIVVGNKLGTHVVLNRGPIGADQLATDGSSDQLAMSPHAPGTDDFARGVRETGPLTPKQEKATFVLPPGFEAQLVAAEPQINKPLNMAFDARERLWVTSTLEYPYPVEVGKPGRDSVKVLEDKDGDGSFESVTTFADGLNIPIGLHPYKDGVICYSIPNIWFLRDTDGDGVCDTREKLYGPFDHTRDTHGMCNGFLRGHDGWMYACHGFNNQSSVSGKDGNTVVMHSGNTFRFKLDGSRIEHFTHGQVNPFGLAYDAMGDLLSADCHTKPVTLLLQGGYYDSFGKPHDGLGYVPAVMQHLHGSTAIGGIAIATPGTPFPADYIDNTFGGNVMTSRINRNSLIYNGASVRAQEEPDLLISGDSWFRPVDLKFGPDGALYVADFYNRIIGHYEVPLEHPGRDRKRGRIWRIVYRGDKADNASISAMSLDELIGELASPQATRRSLASHRITDDFATTAIPGLNEAFARPKSSDQKLQVMWALHRLDAFSDEQTDQAIADSDPLVRTHLFRLLGEKANAQQTAVSEQTAMWLRLGFEDQDPRVQRAAATAATQAVSPLSVDSLLDACRRIKSNDPHLRHAFRMALRDHLLDESIFSHVTAKLDANKNRQADIELVAEMCLSLRTPWANAFLAKHIDAWPSDKEKLNQYLEQAMQGVTDLTANGIVNVARRRFSTDLGFQIELLRRLATDTKLTQIGAIRKWAQDIVIELLDGESNRLSISWTYVPHPDTTANDNPWAVSEIRKSADTGDRPAKLWSSYPQGEHRTGIYRSGAFQLPAKFSFYMAGHDGYPQEKLQNRNLVRLRDASTNEILQSWSPPRNDVAQQMVWNSGEHAGQEVFVEMIDGDTATAYAWLAVGRFSVEGLNPNDLAAKRTTASQMIADFQLSALRPQIVKLLLSERVDNQTRASLSTALASLAKSSQAEALAQAMHGSAVTTKQQMEFARALSDGNSPIEPLLGQVLQAASAVEQASIARRLSIDSVGTGTLLRLAEQGKLSTHVLSDAALQGQLAAVATPEQQALLAAVLESLPAEAETIQRLIEQRKSDCLGNTGDTSRGRQVFTAKCAVCHQVAGEGKQVGPNLDGIGNRGIDRLCEDILAPHRNVDSAFRASTVVTQDGKARTGLIKSEDDDNLTLVENTGVAQTIAKSEIEVREQSKISAMPSNFGEVLSDRDFCDLMSYLLTLKQ